MGKAISKVFLNTKHWYCAWHVQRHVLEHLQPFRSRYDDFEDTYNQWVKSQYVEEFESRWEKLKEKYHIEDDSWLGNMFKLRHHLVKAYLKDTFVAGMTTSGRSESIHLFFDGFVNAKTMLNEFVVQYDKAKEWKASFDCGHEILSTDGVKVIYRVGFETSGIWCKHILYIMRRESLTTIPDHYIIPMWTMKATYKVGVQDGRDSLDDINKIDVVLNGLLEEQSRRKKTSVELNTNINDDIPSTHQENISQHLSKKKRNMPKHILVSDLVVRVKKKGRQNML
uniref:Protein FAR1-related sequence 5-like n=1 Tax=Tanacetum cinerariifolium TaxID=118510 RepID=A0A6L2MAF2_TANCI|nr:protein FAR1-related sequence 5-like [Tanacetum cinerariifolium]